MSTPHVATLDQWSNIEKFVSDYGYNSCLLELRARVEALEAGAACPHVRTSDEGSSYCTLAEQHQDKLDRLIAQDRAASAEARPGGLVERVVDVFLSKTFTVDDPVGARAAIREVAAWLRAGRMLHAAELLEQEADR